MTLPIRTVCALMLAASALAASCDGAGEAGSEPATRIAPAQPIPEFAPGVTVVAAQYPSLQGILGEGFAPKETSGAWTDGGRAVIRLPVAQSALGKPLQLDLKLAPYLHPPELTRQSVEVRIDSAVVTTSEITDVQTIAIPFTAAASPAVFEFILPTAASPESFKAGDDPRKLGIYLISIAVTEPAAPAVETPLAAPIDTPVPAAAPPPVAQPAPAKPVTPPVAKPPVAKPSPPDDAQTTPAPVAPAPDQPTPTEPPPQ